MAYFVFMRLGIFILKFCINEITKFTKDLYLTAKTEAELGLRSERCHLCIHVFRYKKDYVNPLSQKPSYDPKKKEIPSKLYMYIKK
jgi:uncharacterized C2H2 Zn-finger protein